MTSPSSTVDGLVGRIERLRAARSRPRVLVGIAGLPGAGKSTLATELVHRLAGARPWPGSRVGYLPLDGFHLADVELHRQGLQDRKGAPETFDAAGFAALLARVAAGETVWAPAFDRTLEQPIAQSLPILAATEIVVVEGNYLLLPDRPWCEARTLLDEAWFLRIDDETRRERLTARHIRFGKAEEPAREWIERVDERNARLVATTESAADLIVDAEAEWV